MAHSKAPGPRASSDWELYLRLPSTAKDTRRAMRLLLVCTCRPHCSSPHESLGAVLSWTSPTGWYLGPSTSMSGYPVGRTMVYIYIFVFVSSCISFHTNFIFTHLHIWTYILIHLFLYMGAVCIYVYIGMYI